MLQELHCCFIPFEVGESGGRECVAKFLLQDLGVCVSDTEGEQGSYVAENRLADREWKLIDVLMREGEAQTILPGFRENRSKGVGREILELVDYQMEVVPLLLGAGCTYHGSQLKLRDEQGTQKVRFVVAQSPF